MREILILRVRATGRIALHLLRSDPLLAAGVLAGLIFGAWYLWGVAQTGVGARKMAAAGVALVALLHLSRRDARFLTLAGQAPRHLFAVEYLILLIPVAGLLVLGAEPWLAPLALSAGPLITLAPAGRLSSAWVRGAGRRPLPTPVPATDFEWVSGIRRSILPFAVLYLLAIPSSAIPAGPIVLLLIVTWLACGYYTEGEGWQLIQVFGLGPGAFLRAKVGRAIGMWALVVAPLAILFLARHPALWPALAVALTGSAAVLAGSVLAKYSIYQEGRSLGAFGSLVPIVLTGALLIPPIAIYLFLRLWRLAARNLDHYLHAFD